MPIHDSGAWPLGFPPLQPGPVVLPGTGRLVYWTGRVAIGLRHQPVPDRARPVPHSHLWVQELMLATPAHQQQQGQA